MPQFSKLISYQYLFQIDSLRLAHSDWWFLYIGIALVVVAILLKLAQRFLKNPIDKEYANKLFKISLLAGLCEAAWFPARYENVMFFGSHFVALLILLVTVVWGAVVKIKFWRGRKAKMIAWQKEQIKQKYLTR